MNNQAVDSEAQAAFPDLSNVSKGTIRFNAEKNKYELVDAKGEVLLSSKYSNYLQDLVSEQKHAKIKDRVTYVEYVEELIKEIPVFTKQTLDDVKLKQPGFYGWLTASTPEAPRKRGRPQKHNLPPLPEGVHVNKLSDDIPMCNPLTKPVIDKMLRFFTNMPGTTMQRIEYLSTVFKLPYQQIHKSLEKLI